MHKLKYKEEGGGGGEYSKNNPFLSKPRVLNAIPKSRNLHHNFLILGKHYIIKLNKKQ